MALFPARSALVIAAFITLGAMPGGAGAADPLSSSGLLGNALKGLGAPTPTPAQPATPAQQPATPTVNNLSGDNKPAPKTAGPVALVDDVSGVNGVEIMDSLTEGQTIQLGTNGKLVISHTDGCLIETAIGGMVTIHQTNSTSVGGQVQAVREPNCATPHAIATADAREAGGTVSRITPFQGNAWTDVVIKGPRPFFVWPGVGEAKITVSSVDASPAVILWTGKSKSGRLDYPANAPALRQGVHHLVEVTLAGAPALGALFSVDPDLTMLNSVASRLVRVESPGLTLDAFSATAKPLASN